MKKGPFFIFLFCLALSKPGYAQPSGTEYKVSDTCHSGEKIRKKITMKTAMAYERFGETIIAFKGGAYLPCNLPPGLLRRKLIVSLDIFKRNKQTTTPARITYLKVLDE